ncbi:MAG: hypothetical protein NVSMB9_15250 [Isosphaeraceae bacterium]
METRGPSEPPDLHHLKIDVLRQSVRLYLEIAYPGGEIPQAVQRRIAWDADIDIARLLNNSPFEKTGKSTTGGATIYALRLGNEHYPHMKLQIQPWANDAGFLLSVNTHDQVVALDPNASDLPAFRKLQADNQRFKEAIEQAWDEAGLPTFLRYLRDYLQTRNAQASNPASD